MTQERRIGKEKRICKWDKEIKQYLPIDFICKKIKCLIRELSIYISYLYANAE